MSSPLTRTYPNRLWGLLAKVSLVIGVLGTTFLAVHATATVYYVSLSGSDNNDGRSLDTPFRTIQKCANVATAGDTCLIRGGTYRETVVVPTSGAAGNPITFKNYNNESATISGAEVIPNTSWTLHSGNIYKAPMNWSLNVRTGGFNVNDQVTNNQIFVDGQMMVEARWPNIPVEKVTRLTNADKAQAVSATVANTYTATYFDPKLSVFPANYWQDTKINFGPGWNTVHTTCNITASGSNFVTFQCNSDPGANNSRTSWEVPPGNDAYRPSAGNYYYLWGKLGALDYPGEWFRDGPADNGLLYLWTPDDSAPSTHIVEARKRLWAFDLRDTNYITIDGIRFFAATLRTGDYGHYANHLLIQNIEARYLWHFQEIPPLFWESGTYGIELGGDDNVLRDSYLAYSAGPMVRLYGQRNLASNNVIQDGAYMGSATVATGSFTHFSSSGGANTNLLRQNTIFNGGNTLVNAWAGLDITYNDLYNSHLQISDLGTIYGWTVDGKNAEIAYNLVHDNWAELNYGLKYWGGMGISMDNDTRSFVIHHNVVWNTTRHGLFAAGVDLSSYPSGSNRKFYDNTVDGGIGARAKQGNGLNQTLLGTEFKNNYATSSELTDPDLTLQNNRLDYPLIVKQRGQDYGLRHDSPAIDAGVIIPGYTDGYVGAAPDIGAYEFGRPPFVAGAVLRPQDLVGLTITCAANVGDTANCTVSNLPLGRKLSADFQIRIGTSGTPAQNCFTRMDYATHSGTGICEGVSIAGLPGIQPIYVKLGPGSWQDSGATVDLGSLAITAIIPPTGPHLGGILVMLVGRRFDTAYSGYQVPITLTNISGSPLYNYQALVTLDTAGRIAQGKLRTDCGDLRFNDAYGNLDYWQEDGCNTDNTRLWVRVPVLPAGSSQITMTYGMPWSASASDGRHTFVFFDDFDVGVMDTTHWWKDSGAWYTVIETGGAMRIFGATDSSQQGTSVGFGLMTETLTLPASFAIDSELTVLQSSANFKATAGSQDLMLYGGGAGNYKNIGFWQSGIGWTWLGQSTIHAATLNRQKLSVTYTGSAGSRTVRWLENGNLTDVRASRAVSDPSYGPFRYSPNAVASFDVRFNDIRIRSYIFPEPTVVVGGEATSGVRVTIGGRPCINVSVSNGGSLTCILPAHPVGTVDVTIMNSDGQTFTLAGGFEYFQAYPVYLPLVLR